jgi:hypothetical protein
MNNVVLMMFELIIDMQNLNKHISIPFVKDNDKDMSHEIHAENHEQLNRIWDNYSDQ